MLVDVNELQLGCIREYASSTGRTAEECVAEAFDDWIRTVASTISQFENFRGTIYAIPVCVN